MRQRKVKNEEARLAAMTHYTVENPRTVKGCWGELAAAACANKDSARTEGEGRRQDTAGSARPELYLELGCGRGHFLATLAQQHPERFYIGAEGRSSIVLRALERADALKLPNLIFIAEFISHVEEYFAPGELAGVYLNFSDPWPKARYAKHRLTHRSFLEGYKKALKPGGFLEIKTDNNDLFAFTLEELQAVGFSVEECTEDLHITELPARLVTTQYEERFMLLGEKINYCRARAVGVSPPEQATM